jgi:hypothetical protein
LRGEGSEGGVREGKEEGGGGREKGRKEGRKEGREEGRNGGRKGRGVRSEEGDSRDSLTTPQEIRRSQRRPLGPQKLREGRKCPRGSTTTPKFGEQRARPLGPDEKKFGEP